jgi:hypothetical protein
MSKVSLTGHVHLPSAAEPTALQSDLREELRTAAVEPLLPIEKKLIVWSLSLGLVLLAVRRRSTTSSRRRSNPPTPKPGSALAPDRASLTSLRTGEANTGDRDRRQGRDDNRDPCNVDAHRHDVFPLRLLPFA